MALLPRFLVHLVIDGPETARLQRANGSQGRAEVKSLRLCTHRCEISSRGRSETELPWILTAGASGVLLAEGTLPAEPSLRVTCIQNDIHRNLMLRKNCSYAFAPRGTRSRSCYTVNWCHRYKYGTLEVLRTRNSFSSECFSRSRFCTGRKPSRTTQDKTKQNLQGTACFCHILVIGHLTICLLQRRLASRLA